MTTGAATSEFWGAGGTVAVILTTDMPVTKTICATVIVCIYLICRTVIKYGTGTEDTNN